MKNISFDNPYLLLLIIPLLLLLLIPFFITRSKDNKTLGWGLSLGLHILLSVIVTLAAAGIMSESVVTKTTVYVLADVSYSSERNLDEIDAYIEEISESLPENSKLGVVCFGKNVVMHTPAGRKITSVAEADVDDSATNLVGALKYTGGLFDGGSIKRIVLITDGNDTVNNSPSSIASAVEQLVEAGVKIDTIFLDNSLKEGDSEVQLSGVEYSESTYIGHESFAKLLIQSSTSTEVMVELFARERGVDTEYEKIGYTVVSAESGLSTLKMSLPTDKAGTFDYKAVITADVDGSASNNERTFTQQVVGKTSVLLVTGESSDAQAISMAYGDMADIDSYTVSSPRTYVPFTLEALIPYDEIILSNVDVRNINNANAFVDSLDTVVSQYGKSLVTLGDLYLQTEEDDPIFNKLEEILPVKYGSTSREGKLYTIVLDVSHSMFMAMKFTIAKESAIKLLSILNEEDYICLVTFSGEIKVRTPQLVGEVRQELIRYIDSLETAHGTDIGLGLEEALKAVQALNLAENQVMLISDGFSFDNTKDAKTVAKQLFDSGVPLSIINTYVPSDGEGGRQTLREISRLGEGGNYYEISNVERVEDVVFGQVANDVTEAIVTKNSTVNIERYKDEIAEGFSTFPSVQGYIRSMEKYDATVPLTVNYVKSAELTERMPLYAYRAHGNGRVASFTSSVSGNWSSGWTSEQRSLFISNLLDSATPAERVSYPFTLKIERTAYDCYVELLPSVLNASATVKMTMRLPSGRVLNAAPPFDSQKYFYTFTTDGVGSYELTVTYTYGDKEYTTVRTFEVPYLPEYDAFAAFDKAGIYEFIRGMGTLTEGEIPSLENDASEVTTYRVSYRIPLLIAAACVFLADVAIRTIRINRKRRKTALTK